MPKPIVDVAIAILLHHGKVLAGWREATQHQGNKHEFPGGKVEAGETPEQACRREVFEEVGIGIKEWHPFDLICHEYDDVIVNLHIFQAAVPAPLLDLIQQPWTWYQRDQLLALNFPKANRAMLQRLYWPHQIKISANLADCAHLSDEQLMYWRTDLQPIYAMAELEQCTEGQLSRLIVPHALWLSLKPEQQKAVFAVHLSQRQLMGLRKGQLTVGIRHLAACHDDVSIQHAQQIGCDAIFLSPVFATPTHPEAKGLGWTAFAQWASISDLPVFALGGVKPQDLAIAQQHFAYGVAGIRQF
ncbi:NUDIX domain-containing protein [Acinetobacter sp. CAAS 2-6]|uniref:NUDIX domain-containing protein n=1 Tax=Acinetobacter sp. CAAS 2-6 TaxID=3016358 RepID=UPI002DD61CA1|nr:NUDIX domain-containing protein [Acinetobacter sp. CAAS 2-6]